MAFLVYQEWIIGESMMIYYYQNLPPSRCFFYDCNDSLKMKSNIAMNAKTKNEIIIRSDSMNLLIKIDFNVE